MLSLIGVYFFFACRTGITLHHPSSIMKIGSMQDQKQRAKKTYFRLNLSQAKRMGASENFSNFPILCRNIVQKSPMPNKFSENKHLPRKLKTKFAQISFAAANPVSDSGKKQNPIFLQNQQNFCASNRWTTPNH